MITKDTKKAKPAEINNLFLDSRTFRTLDIMRVAYLAAAMGAYLITEFGRFVYRPWVNSHHLNDFGLADSIGNLGGIIVQIFFSLAILNPPKRKAYNYFLFLVGGYILYEIAQPYLPKGVFDWKDIYGTLAGGLLALVVFELLHKVIKKNKTLCVWKRR
jgi:hypothetical protein